MQRDQQLSRKEWSEGAVSILLDAYQTKWVQRNRAKLKSSDWEDVARHVSSRANSTKSPKTQTQCKNKMESIKKRYRVESAGGGRSSWPLFPRLRLLLDCACPSPIPPPPPPPLDGVRYDEEEVEKKGKRRRRKCESVGWLLEEVEKGKVETMRELEKVREDLEARMEKINMKRTQIIANTQLEIARLLFGGNRGRVRKFNRSTDSTVGKNR